MPTPRESGAKLFRQEFDLDIGQETLPPVVRLCNLILTEGILTEANAIRLQRIDADKGGVEYESAGAWRMVMQMPIQAFGLAINRLKVMACLDISHQPSQVGEVHVRLKGARRILRIRTELKDGHETAMLIVSSASAT
jgi:type II secretory ATPase GspE/PulE/Tfp pilus assembly ATPase PilB-like protein